MQGRLRLLILLALIIIVVAIGAAFLLGQQPTEEPGPEGTQEAQPQDTPEPTDEPVPTAVFVDIVIAVQQISRGEQIRPDAVRLEPWPEPAPFNAILDVEEVVGRRARTDIFVEQPILTSLIVDDLSQLADVGSDAAAIIPPGQVMVAVPMDRVTSVAYGIQPGDRVNVIVSLLYVDVDQEFQSRLPNEFSLLSIEQDPETGSVTISFSEAVSGRPETLSLQGNIFGQSIAANWPAIEGPQEQQRPRLTVQQTIQDALVMHVGNFPPSGRLFEPEPTPTPVPLEVEPTLEGAPAEEVGTPAPPTEIPRPDIVALAVSPQEAVVLTWFVEARIPITFALRSAADTQRQVTDAVTLQYIMDTYNIQVPAAQTFAIEPAIRSIRQLIAGEEISLQEESAPAAAPQEGQ